MAQYIKVEVSDYVAVVTMDRPPVNAQNTEFRSQIMEAFDAFNDREDVRGAILTGAGNVFSAGANILATLNRRRVHAAASNRCQRLQGR